VPRTAAVAMKPAARRFFMIAPPVSGPSAAGARAAC
jgi:hypothetical protein